MVEKDRLSPDYRQGWEMAVTAYGYIKRCNDYHKILAELRSEWSYQWPLRSPAFHAGWQESIEACIVDVYVHCDEYKM